MDDILTRDEARDEYGRLLDTFLLHSGWNDRGNALRTRYDVTVRKAYFKLGLGVPGSTPLGIIEEAVLNELEPESLKKTLQRTRANFNRIQYQYCAGTDWEEEYVKFTEKSYKQTLDATANLIFSLSQEPIPDNLKRVYRLLIISPDEARDEYGRLLDTFLLHSGWNDRGNALRTRYDVTVRKAHFKLGLGVPGSTPLGIIEEAVLNELESDSLKRAAQETRDCFNRLQHQYSAETDWGEKSVEFTEESYGQALEATANLIFVFSREPIPEKLKLAYRRFTPAVMEGDEWASVSILADLSDGASTLAEGGRLAEGLLRLVDSARASGLDKVNFHLYLRQTGEVTGLNVRSVQDMYRNSESSVPRGHELLEEILESNREDVLAEAPAFTPWLIWLRRDATPMAGRTLELFKEEVSAGRLRLLRLPLNEEARRAFSDEYAAAGLRGQTPPTAEPTNLPLDIKLILNTLRFELRKAGIAKYEDPK